jgi:hypothetical protein
MSAISLQGNAGGTGTLTVAAPSTNTNQTLTLPDGTGTFSVAGVNSNIVAGTVNAGGTNPFPASLGPATVDFTGIPSYVKRITVIFNGVSTSGTSNYLVQIGAGSITSTGYLGASLAAQAGSSSAAGSTGTSGFVVADAVAAAYIYNGSLLIQNISGNIWIQSGTLVATTAVRASVSGGNVTLSGALDRVRITTQNGTDLFDAGSINILYE